MHHLVDDDDLETALDQAARRLRVASRVAALSGAGVSAESGLATFRGSGGLWEGHRVEDVATPEAFAADPAMVWRFYHRRRAALASVRPNPGHFALARMEQRWGPDRFTLATQNIDGLHRAAGSQSVLELHGSLIRVRCSQCDDVTERGTDPLPELPRCDHCGGLLRPDVVWFGEMLPPDVWERAASATGHADAFLVVGTSAVVFPAAGLIEAAKKVGAYVVEVNLEATQASSLADVSILGPSGQTLPQLAERLK